MISATINKVLNSPEFHIAVFAFLLNFVWELLQMPLFIVAADYPYYEATIHCTIATFGDVIISLVAYFGACLVTRSRIWVISMNRAGVISFLAIGLMFTISFEVLATGPLNWWQYGESMPVIPLIDIGFSPVVQWLTLPLLQLWFVRRQLIGGGVYD